VRIVNALMIVVLIGAPIALAASAVLWGADSRDSNGTYRWL